jgi:hypothetical protein
LAKVRVFELAKEFRVEAKAVMAALEEMGEFVRSESSTIEAPVVRRLKERFPEGAPSRAEIVRAITALQFAQAESGMARLQRVHLVEWEALEEEFGVLLGEWRARGGAGVRRVEWLTGLWAATSATAPGAPEPRGPRPGVVGAMPPPVASRGVGRSRPSSPSRPDKPRPEVLGRELEEGFAGLLATLFDLSDKQRVRIRKQSSGTQFGHDLEFDAPSRVGAVRCHVECKNLTGRISLYDVAPKLLQQLVYWENKPLDYFIVIAPKAEATNELSLLIQDCNHARKLPFQVLLWSADTGVEELFRLAPDLYRTLYERPAPALTAESAAEIARNWEEQLRPTVRIPDSWLRYLKTPERHAVYGEEDFAAVRQDAILLGALSEGGALVSGTLHENVREWLTERPERTLLLLAEFGDGKSFFGYELGLKLAAEFLDDPAHGWVALRIPLRSLRDDSQPSSLLQGRLDKIGLSAADWAEVTRSRRTLVILDGFDEMSAQLDPRTLAKNVEVLVRCVEYFSPAKVLISSRTHFFEHLADYEQFLQDLGNPRILRIAPIPLHERLAHLEAFAARKGLEAKLARLKGLYDPIGLAAKPLFLHMIKVTLPNLREGHFSEVALYQQYVHDSLRRKVPDLQPARRLDEDTLVMNLTLILEELAVQLHLSRSDYVNLREFDTGRREDLSAILWAMSGAPSTDRPATGTPDARSRVGVRSLLKPVTDVDPEGWPVDFFHRSMREFFVARALVRAVAEQNEKAVAMLARVPLQPEIIEFARLLMRQPADLGVTDTPETFAYKLMSLAKSAILPIYRDQYLGGNALTLLFALNRELPKTDWSGLALDYADLAGANLDGLSFRGSSLRNVSLDNATLVGTDLRDADLTGVQLEQTAPVLALTFDADSNTAYAAYGDRSVRRWSFGVGGRMSCITLAELDFQPTRLDLSPFGDLLARGAGTAVVLSALGGEEAWRVVSRFPVSEKVRDFSLNGDQIILPLRRSNGQMTCMLYDPVKRTWVGTSFNSGGTRPFILGESATLVARKDALILSVRGKQWLLPVNWPASSFDCRRLGDDLALVAIGHEDGGVSLWRLDGLSSEPKIDRIWQHRAHTGSVTDVRLSGMFVLSGGMDRTICLFTLSDDWATTEPLRLHRTLECVGMRIDGVRGRREKDLLESLLRAASPQPSAPSRIPTPAEVFGGQRATAPVR